jgi:hypothetical protein
MLYWLVILLTPLTSATWHHPIVDELHPFIWIQNYDKTCTIKSWPMNLNIII